MSDFKDYRYIGMPFHAVGFPQPVYSHLMGSNDGINWDDLKSYDFGWRDVDIAYINGEYWTCTGTYVNRTKDFENFTQINCPKIGLKNLWASEFFQAQDGQWWFIYCGSETDVDYSEYKLYASKIYPDSYQIDSNRLDVNLSASGGYIDPNLNYINGSYYLWTSRTDMPTQELRLFKSNNVLGPYYEINTNVMNLVNEIGMTWDEAPEMLQENGIYYLYSDPWNHGDDESKRDVYRCESTDLTHWSNMTRCNAYCTMRHFTPLDIGTVNNHTSLSLNISMWDGNAGSFETTSQTNFQGIKNLVDTINELSKQDGRFIPVNIDFDLQILSKVNRGARNQFIDNAQALSPVLQNLFNDYRYFSNDVADLQKTYQEPVIPTGLILDKTTINNYWATVANDLNFAIKAVNDAKGGE